MPNLRQTRPSKPSRSIRRRFSTGSTRSPRREHRGALIAFGPRARVLVAGTTWEAGRVVAFAHNGYLAPEALDSADTGRLLVNAIQWAGAAAPPHRRVAVLNHPALGRWLEQHAVDAVAISKPIEAETLKTVAVLVTDPGPLERPEAHAAVAAFVTHGGGLVIADCAWGWAQLHPRWNLTTDHPGNLLLYPAGLIWTGGFSERTARAGFQVGKLPSELLNAGTALKLVMEHQRGQRKLDKDALAQAQDSISLALSVLPETDTVLLGKLRAAPPSRSAPRGGRRTRRPYRPTTRSGAS